VQATLLVGAAFAIVSGLGFSALRAPRG